jgi:outer membrane murein-binding lipoprotein Lpp
MKPFVATVLLLCAAACGASAQAARPAGTVSGNDVAYRLGSIEAKIDAIASQVKDLNSTVQKLAEEQNRQARTIEGINTTLAGVKWLLALIITSTVGILATLITQRLGKSKSKPVESDDDEIVRRARIAQRDAKRRAEAESEHEQRP